MAIEDRLITLSANSCPIPERLLLAHSQGRVLFVTGAGISRSAGLPDFRDLTLLVYKALDASVHSVLAKIPRGVCNLWEPPKNTLRSDQLAEVQRFISGEFDVTLGMLERRIDGKASSTRKVRQAVEDVLDSVSAPAPIHHSLIKLAFRGSVGSIVTTNFDLLLERAAKLQRKALDSFALTGIPRPGRADDFSGVFHIHGALKSNSSRGRCIVTDEDFGEFYLRRQIVPDFIYEAARLFRIVFVGYSASDPPMRYLLNAIAADGSRFDDLQERFAFVGHLASGPDPVVEQDWRARGIVPIFYDSSNQHAQLTSTLNEWATASAINGKREKIERFFKRTLKKKLHSTPDADRDLVEHFYRRSSNAERRLLAKIVANARPEIAWLDVFTRVDREPR